MLALAAIPLGSRFPPQFPVERGRPDAQPDRRFLVVALTEFNYPRNLLPFKFTNRSLERFDRIQSHHPPPLPLHSGYLFRLRDYCLGLLHEKHSHTRRIVIASGKLCCYIFLVSTCTHPVVVPLPAFVLIPGQVPNLRDDEIDRCMVCLDCSRLVPFRCVTRSELVLVEA